MEEKTCELLDFISSGIAILKIFPDGRLTPEYGNSTLYRMLKREEACPGSSSCADIPGFIHPDDRQRVVHELRQGYGKENFLIKNYRMLCGDGSFIFVTTELKLCRREPGCRLFTATYTDMTEAVRMKKELEERLENERRLTEKAMTAIEEKARFLSNISHDMRTPLNAIIGFTGLALSTEDRRQREEYLSHIQTSGKFLLELINDTLELSKIENGKLTLHPEIISCSDMIRRVLVSIQPSIQEKNISLVLDNSRAVMADIRVDVLRVQEIFLNILSNALKYTPEGGRIDLIIECVKLEENCVHDRLIIKDSGAGIDSEFLPHIFEPFTQEDVQKGNNITGTGLGLSIVKKLVELMDGTIEVQSRKGEGTVFTVNLDFERIQNVPLEKDGSTPVDLTILEGRNVLLCEDHPLNRELETVILEQAGMRVICAENGQEGVGRFAASSPGFFDAVLMDIRMPVMNGLDAARTIRALPRPDAGIVPIIAITADAYEEDRKLTEASGMNAHIAKPIDGNILYRELAFFLKTGCPGH